MTFPPVWIWRHFLDAFIICSESNRLTLFALLCDLGACRISKIPRNGWVEYAFPPNDKLGPGEFVNSGTIVNFKCLVNHIIEGPTANFCFQGKWKDQVPDCKPRCSTKAISGISITPTACYLNDIEVRCSEPAQPGTIARINCRDRYERQSTAKQQVINCGDDGIWSPLPETCSPICGEEAPTGTPYVVGGFEASINKVPWHAGIYKFNGNGFSLQCGGTIINARVVVSAMHCKSFLYLKSINCWFWTQNNNHHFQ